MNPKTDHPVAAQQSEERREVCDTCGSELIITGTYDNVLRRGQVDEFYRRTGCGKQGCRTLLTASPSIPTETRGPEILDTDLADSRKYASECFGHAWGLLSAVQQAVICNIVLYKIWAERALARSETREKALEDALAWALDLLDMYDERLAKIDGPEVVYPPIHLKAKAKARTALERKG